MVFKYIILISLINPTFANPRNGGQNFEFEVWRFGKKIKNLVYLNDKKILLSKNCIKLRPKFALKTECLNKIAFIKDRANKNKMPKIKGGKNPGAVFCRKVMNGKVIFGKDMNEYRRSFCQIKGTIIIDNLWILKNYGKS